MSLQKMNLGTTFKHEKSKIRRNIDSNIGNYSEDLFAECYSVLTDLTNLEKVAHTCTELEMDFMDFFDFQMSGFESFTGISYSTMQRFNEELGAGDSSLQRRLRDTVMYLDSLVEFTGVQYNNRMILNDEETEKFYKIISSALGTLSMFMFYQFSVDKTIEGLEDMSNSVVIDADFASYCDKNGIEVLDGVKFIFETHSKYKPTLLLFEEYPELLEDFEDVVGSSLYDFLDCEELLTRDIVVGIIQGKLSHEAVLEELMGDA